MLEKVSSFFKQTPKKSPQRPVRRIRQPFEVKEEKTIDAPIEAKKLFWGKNPYYPEMGSAYRKLCQSLKIDNNKTIKLHETFCGTDMCNIVSGLGPNVDYNCHDDEAIIIQQNIKKFALEKKTEKITEATRQEDDTKQYFAHIMSLIPVQGDDMQVDWENLAEKTLSGGYVIIPRKITAKDDEKKPSQKLGDNIEFYFYSKTDHTEHWISIIEAKFNLMKTMDPELLTKTDKQVIKAFSEEATKWAMELKQLKTGEQKILSMIYKRDDVAD